MDLNSNAFRIVSSLTSENDGLKRKKAASRSGGLIGGVSRAAALSAEKRKEIAVNANAVRWERAKKGKEVGAMISNFNDPQAVSVAAERIYNDRYKNELESSHLGEFAAINVMDEAVTLGTSASEALANAKKAHPHGFFHLIRIGHQGTFEVGLALRNVTPNRLYR